jgi:DNA-binding CsgD family transcriptional regulator
MTPATRKRLKAASITERNKAICDARNEGASLREIAVIVGLTHAGVRKIINQSKGATP